MVANARTSLLIVGDSITLGVEEIVGSDVRSTVSPTYVDRLRQAHPSRRFAVDAAVHRTTVQAGRILNQLLASHRPQAALLMVGGNDADLDWRRFILTRGKVARSNLAVDRFRDNLRGLARACIAAGTRPILSDLPRQDLLRRGAYLEATYNTTVVDLIHAGGGQAEADRRLGEYNAAVAQVANELDAPVAAWGREIDPLGFAAFGVDGIHPNADAHERIAAAVECVLDKVESASPGAASRSLLVGERTG